MKGLLGLSLLIWLFGVCATLQAQEMTLELDPANTKINFTLDATLHTVHGGFKLKSGTIHFNPTTGTAGGQIIVDATSGDTQNDGRDHKMHKVVLESAKYPEITFTATKVTGRLVTDADSTVQVEGIFQLHGTDHPINASVPVHVHGAMLDAKTSFVVPYASWGLKNPSTFILHVSEKVNVDVSASGHLKQTEAQP
jgi:polyisoprenoid-binding protein YceI